METFILILLISSLIQIIIFWIVNRNRKKIHRSDEAFNLVANQECICSSTCNEFCSDKYSKK